MEEREFDVGKDMLKGSYNKCMVCLQKLELGDKIILCPIQKPRKGWGNAISIPIHVGCYWIEEEKDD